MSEIVQEAKGIIANDNIVKRMLALFDSLMVESKIIPAMLQPTVNNLVHNFLDKADPGAVEKYICQVRDQIIPWLLEGDKSEDNKQ